MGICDVGGGMDIMGIEVTDMDDTISRQAALDAVNSLIDRFERILSDIRESTVDDSVCGMCEYDGAFVGQSGDWCNECPGFEKDDCFKLSDECRKRWLESVKLPSAQPEIIRCGQCKYAEVADTEDSQDGYTCQFHRGSIWFSGSYCSWAERRHDG